MKRTRIYTPFFILILLAVSGLAKAQETVEPLPLAIAPQSADSTFQVNDHGPWDIVILDDQNDVGSYLSMAVDRTNGAPTIAYYDADRKSVV